MKKFLQRFTTAVYYLTYPLNTTATNGSERCRVLIVSPNNKVAVLKPWLSDGYWHLPGGGIRKNESPGQGAAREVHEELGLELKEKELKFIRQVKFNVKGFIWDLDILMAILADEPALHPCWYEIGEAKWIDPKELNEKNASPDLLICLKNCYNKDYV